MKCMYCLDEISKCQQDNCPDKVAASPARDHAMASWGAGRCVALMGEVLSKYKMDNPYFVRGYNTGAVKRDEDSYRPVEDYPDPSWWPGW